MKKVIFTICAKNYLAQALALRSSVKATNPQVDFFVFISDSTTGIEDVDFIPLDDTWIPEWRNMAFKYNVIEFSTSIKPFCINFLFKSYEKVVYLDPDIYVIENLDPIFNLLDTKDVIITPHYCEIQEEYNGAVPEEEILFVGIYNLGFLAVKNDTVGKKIIDWWMNRLANKCFADKSDALHVDQKWFDFIPAFFPKDIEISHHLGINTAIWNLHERDLIIKNDKYFVVNKVNDQEFPLLFFHFSGFNPKNPDLINRRHPKYNVGSFPTFGPLFKVYTKLVLENGFDRFSGLSYGFNVYSNNEKITPLQRRLFREISNDITYENPFKTEDAVYEIFKMNKILTGIIVNDSTHSDPNIRQSRDNEIKKGLLFLQMLKKVIGIKFYNYILVFFAEYHRSERQTFLISNDSLKMHLKKNNEDA